MRQILILKDLAINAKIGGGAIANANEINLLSPGALAIFNDRNELITIANAATTTVDTKSVRYVLGGVDSTEGGTWTLPLPRATTSYKAKSYVAPVKEVQFIGNDGATGALNLPATIVAGTTANIRIIKTSQTVELGLDKFRYERYIKVGDTAAIILADLIAKINADTSCPVTAAVVGANVGISLTAKEFGDTFSVGTDGILEDADIIKGGTSNSVAVVFGCGTPTQIALLEEEFSAERGNGNKLELANKYWTKAPKTDPTETYDTYTMLWSVERNGAISKQVATSQELIIAMPVGATLQANFETLSAAIFGAAGGNEESGADAA